MARPIPLPPANTGIWQKPDGTVLREQDGGWQYLSPLFGEWLDVYEPAVKDMELLRPYPHNLEVLTK